MRSRDRRRPLLSVVITAHNEGNELRRTIESVQSSTRDEPEIIVINDASADESASGVEPLGVRVIRHVSRIGVAFSRDQGAQLAHGESIAFVDGHQQFGFGCLDACARSALRHQTIVWPDVGGADDGSPIGHGATFCLCRQRGFFGATWKSSRPSQRLSRISSLRAPGYVMPRETYQALRWISELRGWGASEAAISLKAFFLDVPILHLCGPLTRHRFKKAFHYSVTSEELWRNQALIARVCFDDRTWLDYWLPRVFDGYLTDTMRCDLESDSVRLQHGEFQRQKVRTDSEFWTRLLKVSKPRELRRTTVGWKSSQSRYRRDQSERSDR